MFCAVRPHTVGIVRDPMTQAGTYSNSRLGSAELAILRHLRRAGGAVPRQLLVVLVHAPTALSAQTAGSESQAGAADVLPTGRARQNAESTLSRALRSLQRKGLIVRTIDRSSRQTLISAADPQAAECGERDAIAAEAFAARCDAVSAALIDLASNARVRASQLRSEGGPISALRAGNRLRQAAGMPEYTSS